MLLEPGSLVGHTSSPPHSLGNWDCGCWWGKWCGYSTEINNTVSMCKKWDLITEISMVLMLVNRVSHLRIFTPLLDAALTVQVGYIMVCKNCIHLPPLLFLTQSHTARHTETATSPSSATPPPPTPAAICFSAELGLDH